VRGNAHARFGGRAGEPDRPKRRHRAPAPPYRALEPATQSRHHQGSSTRLDRQPHSPSIVRRCQCPPPRFQLPARQQSVIRVDRPPLLRPDRAGVCRRPDGPPDPTTPSDATVVLQHSGEVTLAWRKALSLDPVWPLRPHPSVAALVPVLITASPSSPGPYDRAMLTGQQREPTQAEIRAIQQAVPPPGCAVRTQVRRDREGSLDRAPTGCPGSLPALQAGASDSSTTILP
jgi:hypothetical protein